MQSERIDLVARAEATSAVIARFRNQAFDWKKSATCLHLMRAQLVKMGRKPPRIPAFQSAIGARKAMDRAGYADLAAVADAVLPVRIAPAAMIIGDIALLPGDPDRPGGFDAIVICAGAKLIGWHDSDLSRLSNIVVSPGDIVAAWRA